MIDIKNNKSTYLKGVIIGIALCFSAILLSALIILLLKLDRAYSEAFATISVSIGGFASSFYISCKQKSKGYILGLIIGLVFFLFITIISLIVTKCTLTSNTLFHFVIIMLSSVVGGIMGVNKEKNRFK